MILNLSWIYLNWVELNSIQLSCTEFNYIEQCGIRVELHWLESTWSKLTWIEWNWPEFNLIGLNCIELNSLHWNWIQFQVQVKLDSFLRQPKSIPFCPFNWSGYIASKKPSIGPCGSKFNWASFERLSIATQIYASQSKSLTICKQEMVKAWVKLRLSNSWSDQSTENLIVHSAHTLMRINESRWKS